MGMFCFWMGDGIGEWILKEEDLVGFVAGHVEHRFQLQLFLTRLCEFPQRQWCWARPGHPELLEHQGLLSTLQLLQFDSDSTSSCILSTVFQLPVLDLAFSVSFWMLTWCSDHLSVRGPCLLHHVEPARPKPSQELLGGIDVAGRLKRPDRLTCHSDFPFCLGLLPTLSVK